MAEKRQTKDDQIAQLEARLDQLKRQRAAEDRKSDARRKIILGGAMIAEMNSNPDFHQAIAGILRKRVTKPKDQEAVQEWLSIASPQASSPGPQGTPVQQRLPIDPPNA